MACGIFHCKVRPISYTNVNIGKGACHLSWKFCCQFHGVGGETMRWPSRWSCAYCPRAAQRCRPNMKFATRWPYYYVQIYNDIISVRYGALECPRNAEHFGHCSETAKRGLQELRDTHCRDCDFSASGAYQLGEARWNVYCFYDHLPPRAEQIFTGLYL